MSNPKVSVIIPCYNREDSVREAVDSVLSQDYDNFDVIAVDDNSTDGTLDVLNSIKDSRLRIVSNPGNNGPCTTRNFGMSMSKSPWIAFQDSDDLWLPGKLRKQMDLVKDSNCVGVYCGLLVEDGQSESQVVAAGTSIPDRSLPNLEGNIIESLIERNFVSTQTIVARRDLLEDIGGFDEAMPALVDWDLMLRLAQKGDIAFVDEDLVLQRFSDNSITRSGQKRLQAQQMVLEKHRVLLRRFPKILAYHHHRVAGALRQLGQYRDALGSAMAAWKIHPTHMKYFLHVLYLLLRSLK